MPRVERDVAGLEPDGPAVVTDDGRPAVGLADQGQRGVVLDSHRPRRIQHHPQHERAARSNPVEQSDNGVHAASLAPVRRMRM